MFVKIIKGACQAFPLYEANHGVSRRLALLLPKGRYAFNVLDLNYSFREVSFDVGKLRQAIGSDEFIRTEAEIAVNETLEQKTGWGISKPSGLQQPKRPSAGIQVSSSPSNCAVGFLISTLFFAFSVVLHLMLLLLILPATLYTNHLKHVETSYIVLRLTFSVCNIS
jgi:hypothetical protein